MQKRSVLVSSSPSRHSSTFAPSTTTERPRRKLSRRSSEDNEPSGTHTPRGRKIMLDAYLSSRSSSQTSHRSASPSCTGSSPSTLPRRFSVRRWDGARRTTTSWDGVRRDLELWYSDGDCIVHYHAQGHSKRGPSLKVPLAAIEDLGCDRLFQKYAFEPGSSSRDSWATLSSHRSSISSNSTSPDLDSSGIRCELFIPAPTHLSREDAFKHHLTTRNFFAWALGKPLVGVKLTWTLINLLERMNEYRAEEENNLEDLLHFIDGQEYTDFRECPDHALAVLGFAEFFKLQTLWTDAFVHCAGMYKDLASSGEYEMISRASKALITRAHLEMDIRVENAGRSISTFLEDDFSRLPLDPSALSHLERFRSFLHSFYVAKYGYWPPQKPKKKANTFPRALYTSMYFEFRRLYEYLVDPHASKAGTETRLAGGQSTAQILEDFDKKAKYSSLPRSVPMIPEVPDTVCQKPQGFSKLFERKQSKSDRRLALSLAVSAATNPGDLSSLDCALVREYLRFEKSCAMDEIDKVSCGDGRRVKWILIYGMLQTLISITRAPVEVRDTEGVSYPMCCQIAGTPPWQVSEAPKSEHTSPQTPRAEASKQEEAAGFYFSTPASLSSSSFFKTATTPQVLTPRANEEVSRPPTMRGATDTVKDTFTSKLKLDTNTKPKQVPFLTTLPSPFPVSSVAVPLQSPQPRKPSFPETFLNFDPDDTSSTPSSGLSPGDGDGWSIPATSEDENDTMDHHSVADATSLYDDGENQCANEMGKVGSSSSLNRLELNKEPMARKFSMRSTFTLEKHNPEVEQYICSD